MQPFDFFRLRMRYQKASTGIPRMAEVIPTNMSQIRKLATGSLTP